MVISSRRGFIPAGPVVRAQATLSRLAFGPPVWLPLARREEITTCRTFPDLRVVPGLGGAQVVACDLSDRRPPRAGWPARFGRACGVRGPAARPHAPCAA